MKALQDDIKARDAKNSSLGYCIALVIALILAGGTFFGLIADTFTPSYHEVVYSQKEVPIPVLPIKK